MFWYLDAKEVGMCLPPTVDRIHGIAKASHLGGGLYLCWSIGDYINNEIEGTDLSSTKYWYILHKVLCSSWWKKKKTKNISLDVQCITIVQNGPNCRRSKVGWHSVQHKKHLTSPSRRNTVPSRETSWHGRSIAIPSFHLWKFENWIYQMLHERIAWFAGKVPEWQQVPWHLPKPLSTFPHYVTGSLCFTVFWFRLCRSIIDCCVGSAGSSTAANISCSPPTAARPVLPWIRGGEVDFNAHLAFEYTF